MHSPIQRWLAAPSNGRWEQPSYASIEELCTTSAALRKRQAMELWDAGVLVFCQRISPGRWAARYASLAYVLLKDCPDKVESRDNPSPEYLWLRKCAQAENTAVSDRAAFMAGVIPLLQQLGHSHVLSRTMVERYCQPNEQISFWRTAFAQDPLHDKMGIALDVGAVRRSTLDGYLRARKEMGSFQEVHDSIDLAILID